MAFSFLNQELAIDLGTANTVIFQHDVIALDEPSIVAIDNNTGKCIALGQKAKLMHERVNPGIKTIRPLRDGVIADFNAAEMMIRGFIKSVNKKHKYLFTPNLKVVVGIPSGSTEVEIRAVRDSSEHAGAREVYLIYEPMAAALGIGLEVEAPKGNMVVDIGGGTTEIAVISLGGIVIQDSIRTAGDVFTTDIQYYLKQQHNIRVGEITAEKVKIAVGAVIQNLDEEPEPFVVRGPNLMTAHPVESPAWRPPSSRSSSRLRRSSIPTSSRTVSSCRAAVRSCAASPSVSPKRSTSPSMWLRTRCAPSPAAPASPSRTPTTTRS